MNIKQLKCLFRMTEVVILYSNILSCLSRHSIVCFSIDSRYHTQPVSFRGISLRKEGTKRAIKTIVINFVIDFPFRE